MKILLIIVMVGLVAMAVYSLIRGIVAFLQASRDDLARDPALGPSPSQLMQNKMMMNRIMFQAGAVLVAALLLAVAS
ncbi:hypothetical protein ACOYW6_10230 [Parablastomonas sp. CN1-191]|uniref:hypothetical protein n=1 Tax=Parablastomonas sp. CN1-191 TaxID=3400908 RepID=UPI003BF845CD